MGLFGLGRKDAAAPAIAPWILEIADRITAGIDAGRIDASRLYDGDGRSPSMPSGSERRMWVAQRLASVVSDDVPDGGSAVDAILSAAVRAELRVPGCVEDLLSRGGLREGVTRLTSILASRRILLASSGDLAMRRVAAESGRLETCDDRTLSRRFAYTPASRLDGPPSDPARRRVWVREMLVGEAAAIASGMVSPERLLAIARSCRAPSDLIPPGATYQAPAFHAATASQAEETRAARAATLARQPSAALSSRFGAIPGFDDGPRTDMASHLTAALVAEDLRRVARMPGSQDASGRPLDLDLAGLSIDASYGLAFTADLVIADERICRISSSGDGDISADMWSDGCGPSDLAALDVYFAAFGEPRENGELPDSLAFRVLDLVAVRVASDGFRAAAVSSVMFVVEGRDGPELLSVPIPSGGDRAGAVAHVMGIMPQAVFLDDMPVDEAAMLWASLA